MLPGRVYLGVVPNASFFASICSLDILVILPFTVDCNFSARIGARRPSSL